MNISEKKLDKIINESINKILNEEVSLYGRTMLTYEDIPRIMSGEIPFDEVEYNDDKFYVLPLPNGRYVKYICNEKNRDYVINQILKGSRENDTYSKKDMEMLIRTDLHSRQEAENWLIGEEICKQLENKGYETEMWSQLGKIGGITARKKGTTKTFRIAWAEPTKKQLLQILDKIKMGNEY